MTKGSFDVVQHLQQNMEATVDLIAALRDAVAGAHVLTSPESTRPYRTGIRFGKGPVAAVVRPATLLEQWRALEACVAHGAVVIMQAANTGLTGGSTPDGADYDRPVVIISTLRIDAIHVISEGREVVCLSGATLYRLEAALKPLGREPHSVIGSSCVGASVVGGIANNSGGALVQRGPAYTEMALFARLDADGSLKLVNTLGIALGQSPEEVLGRLDRRDWTDIDVAPQGNKRASDDEYGRHVRDIAAPTPARFNADARRLADASGSAGKVVIFAVRLDTFAAPERTATFYIGTNDPAELTELRRHMLAQFQTLPVAAEYIHREAFDMAATYGKDVFLAIRAIGTARLPLMYRAKRVVDRLAGRVGVGGAASDRLMQAMSRLWPNHLPDRMRTWRDRFEHHLLLKVAGDGIEEARRYLAGTFPSASGDHFECTPDEADKAFLHRFAVAGAAVRYRTVHSEAVEDIVALDIALRRDDRDWFETLPDDIAKPITHRLYYGHFFCHVFHQDYVVAKGHDVVALEHRMWKLLDGRGAEYPAEHNVGHLYPAKPALAAFYRELDPCNMFNPGVGQLSKCAHGQ